jgi:O-antigen/teichoic acid export membrane protein
VNDSWAKKLFANSSKLMSGAAIGQLITVFSMPIITRLYEPEFIGVHGVFVAVSALLAVVMSLGYQQAFPLISSEFDVKELFLKSIVIMFLFVFILLVILFNVKDFFLHLLNIEVLGVYVYLIPVTAFFIASGTLLEGICCRMSKFSVQARSSVYVAIFNQFSKIFIGINISYLSVLIITTSIGMFIKSFFLIQGSETCFKNHKIDFKNILSFGVLLKYRSYPIFRMPQMLLAFSGQYMPVFIISSMYGIKDAAFFSLAYLALSMPANLLGNSFSSALYKELVDVKEDTGKVYNMLGKTTLALIGISVFPCVFVVVYAPDVFKFVFGENWYFSGLIAQGLVINVMFMFVTKPLFYAVPVINLDKAFLILEGLGVFFRSVSIFMGFYLGFNVVETVYLYSFVSLLVYFLVLVYIFAFVKNNIRLLGGFL